MVLIDPIPMEEPRRITILGSTGSVGCNTVDLVGRNVAAFDVVALTANRNVPLLAEQARKLGAELAVVADPEKYDALREALRGSGIEAAAGPEAVIEAAQRPSDWVMAAIVGAAGLAPTLAAIRRGAVIGLANKECLVSAGSLVMSEVRKHGAVLLPVDSEHSAIFQVIDFEKPEGIEQIILTASGGPFRCADRASMASVTPAQAVAHPNWSMGAKISVDSATMMNKGLELVEAFHLFPVREDQIEILVHPQSVVHSMVSYVDGSVLAQLGSPDMRTPIAVALGWPRRMTTPAARLSLADIGTLTFERPDSERFPALGLARRALRLGNGATTVLNAANEVAVAGFLGGRIGFLEIVTVVEKAMDRYTSPDVRNLDDILALDGEVRRISNEIISQI